MGNKNSTDKAYELTMKQFGSPEKVREMAKMERNARTYDEARSMLKELVNKPLKSRSGVEATVSMNSIDKILSGKAIGKSLDREAHFLAAANLERLFSNAIEPFIFEKNNEHLKAIRRLYAPMAYNDRIIPLKFTVKEMDSTQNANRIYSLEAIDVDLDKK